MARTFPTLRPLWLLLSPLLLSLLLVASACGGGGEEESPQATAPARETPTAEAPAGETPEARETAAPEDFSAELETLVQEWGLRSAKVSYQFSSVTEGEEYSGDVTLYWQPPTAWRVDFSADGDEGIFIARENTVYFCEIESGSCTSLNVPLIQAAPVPFFGLVTNFDRFSEYVLEVVSGLRIERSSRTIAGEDASCFIGTGETEGRAEGEGELCFSDDGIPLLIDTYYVAEDGTESTFRLEATSLERSVSDSDFEPPYPVIELPGFDLPNFDLRE